MKSTIAGVCLLAGIACVILSYVIGGKVSVEDEWTPQQEQQFEELSANVHIPVRKKDQAAEKAAQEAKYEEMQRELREMAIKAEKKGTKMALWISGLSLAVVGICVHFWAQAEAKG